MKKSVFTLLLTASALSLCAQVVVNEYSCANLSQFPDQYGKYEDWIELYNTADMPADIGGYYLSDDEDEPQKWQFPAGATIPAKGYLIVFTSGRNEALPGSPFHTNFKLTQTKNNPEHIVLSESNGLVFNDLEILTTKLHQSVGRLTDGSAGWGIFTQPSPGAANDGLPAYIGFAARPVVDQPAGFYEDSVTVALSTAEPNAVIRYTTDGTEPDGLSPVYGEPLTLSQTTVLKAATFSNNPLILPSFVQYNTYFVNVSHSLIVVSIGADGVQELANGDASLRPHGSIEYFATDGDRKARTYGELNEHGQDSWANDQRSMDWVSRDEMGYNSAIEEKIFKYSDRDEYQRLILRAAGDDNYPAGNHPQNEGSAHIRDAYIHDLAERGHLHVDVRRSEKCIIYLNGAYWGVYDLRERPDDHDYTEFYYNQDKYDIQFIKTWGSTWAEYGGNQALDDWENLYNFITSNDMSNPANFHYVADQYDYESLVDYVIVNSFTVCSDWLNWNTGWWRGFNPEGGHQKWGYILWDNDATFDHYINYTGIPDLSPYADPCNPEQLSGWQDPEGHIQVLNKLRENPVFDQYYITRQADLWNTVFGCENMLSYLDSIIAKIQPEMAQHAERWYGNYDEWQQNASDLRDFISIRCEALADGLNECYDLNGPHATVLIVDPPGAGAIKANTLTYDQFPVSANFFGGVDLKLSAIPAPNSDFEFAEWTATNHVFDDPASPVVKLDLTTADTIVAHFKSTVATGEPAQPGAMPRVAAWPTVFANNLLLDYYLPEKSKVSVTLHSILGDVNATLTPSAAYWGEGAHSLNLDLGKYQLAPGMYWLHFTAGGFKKTIKLVKVDQ
ncbi:MAG: hypothetical protein EPGJADBJ_00120 [Saprospiraceae bacterium]|nr:hypothetical protein [Saprospiraceae bacterium]